MGDVIHALPVLQDIRRAVPGVAVDWVVEPGFAPLVRRAEGITDVIEAPIRRWMKRPWSRASLRGLVGLRQRLRQHHYGAILDLQGLTKSALVARMARGHRYAMARASEGSGYEAPTRWVAQTAIELPFHIHALDRSRQLAAHALGYPVQGPPDFGLRSTPPRHDAPHSDERPCVAFLHGASREDKLWPESSWLSLGATLIQRGWRVGLPHASASEEARARRMFAQWGGQHSEVWPAMALDALMDRLAGCGAAVGVDSGLSHLAVALGLPHVQIYNFPTSWRTGPQTSHGHLHQLSLEGAPPSTESVLLAFDDVCSRAPALLTPNGDLMTRRPSSFTAV